MSKIEKLTAGQKARFPEFVERWTRIGLCTEPADRPKAEAAIRQMYICGGLPPPMKIVWCGSPLSQGLTRAIALDKGLEKKIGDSVRATVWDNVRASVWNSVRANVWNSVRDSVWDSVWDSVRASVWNSVWASVGDSVRASVWDSVEASVKASVWNSVWASVGDSVRDSVYGAHDAYWLGVYSYFRKVCGLSAQTEQLKGLFALAESAGWALPHQNICWVSERHHILERDDSGRLHNLTGPAVMYPDGWAIYAVHGVRVPADVIEQPQSLTAERILKEENAEVRRVTIERIGNERFLQLTNAQAIHEDRRGKLYRIELQGDEPITLVQVVNSTPEPDGSVRQYILRVPPTIQRASEAVAWTFQQNESDYLPEVET